MQIKLNNKKEVEISFSWREIFILLKKRKFIFGENLLDKITAEFIQCKMHIEKIKKDDSKTN